MRLLAKGIAVAVLLAGVSAAAALSGSTPGADESTTVMLPKQGLPLDVGGKRVVGYYEQVNSACNLTIVLAEGATAGHGDASNPEGTRIVVPVEPGRALMIDGRAGRSAEFLCGPEGGKMSARTFTRNSYKAAARS